MNVAAPPASDARAPADLAVLLVHGIGDIEEGDVLRAGVEAVRRNLPGLTVVEGARRHPDPDVSTPESPAGRGVVSSVDVAWNDHTIRIVEYSWASVAGKIRLRYPLQAARRTLEVMREFPMMAALGTPSPRLVRWAATAGRFQQALALGLILLVVPCMIELALRPELVLWLEGVVTPGESSPIGPSDPFPMAMFLQRLWAGSYVFTLGLMLLYVLAGLYYAMVTAGFLYFNVAWLVFRRRLRPIGVAWRGLVVSSVLVFLLALAVVMALVPAFQGLLLASRFLEVRGGADVEFVVAVALGAGWYTLVYWLVLKPTVGVANLLRDAVHYLSAGPDGRLLPHQRTIRSELLDLIRELQGAEGRTHVLVIAHSLGSVIVADLLREALPSDGAVPRRGRLDLVTAGSPLRRFVHRFLPYRIPDASTLCEELHHGALPVQRWFNAYRVLDYVGQALTYSCVFGTWWRARRPSIGIQDHLLSPWYAWPFGHAHYWRDRRFLDFVVKHVARPALEGAAVAG